MGRHFEKISFEQFKKDIKDDRETYEEYELPTRSTKHSAGYDFRAIYDFTIMPGEEKKIYTGCKVKMEPDEALMLYVRGSVGTKFGVRLTNSVGIIDSDYYNNPTNEGHFLFPLYNSGVTPYVVKKGEAYGQGIFQKYLTVDDEEEITEERVYGFGSTN